MELNAGDKFAPIRRTDGYALSEERVDWHLENWKAWESATWDAELAYTLSHGNSYSIDFDDLCAEMDRRSAYTTKAAIESLAPVECCAIHNRLFASVFRFRENAQGAWLRARWKLGRALYRRGLV